MTDPSTDQPVDDGEDRDDQLEKKQGLLDRFRGTGVGVEDPHISGDTSPPEVAPDQDPPASRD
jgi:hypothetical protein